MKWKKVIAEHKCDLPPEEDPVNEFISGHNAWGRWTLAFQRNFTVSMTNPRARRVFKSSASIEFERIRHLKSHKFIIHPYSNFRQNWENIMAFVFSYAILEIPFYIAFINTNPARRYDYVWIALDVSHCIMCIVDIVLNFYTGYVINCTNQGVVLIPWKIFVRYLKTYFIIDLLSSVPIDHLACLWPIKCYHCEMTCLFRYLKMLRLKTLEKYFMRFCQLLELSQTNAEVIWTFAKGFLFLHFAACLHVTLAFQLLTSESTWMEDIMEKDTKIIQLYMAAMARATSHLLRLGYGLSTPKSNMEKGYIMFLCSFGMYLLISTIVSLMKRVNIYNVGSSRYEEIMQEINTYVRSKQIPPDLHRRIVEYYEFRFEMCYFDEREILSALSTNLRQECLLHSCRRLLLNVSFFNNLPVQVLLRIMVCMHAEIYLVNDVIISAGSTEDSMYFITSGTVAVYSATGREMCHLEDGAHFGEIALLAEAHVRRASVVAVESCDLYRLERSDFVRAVAPYPDLLTRIQRVAEEREERLAQMDELQGRSKQQQQLRQQKRRKALKAQREKHSWELRDEFDEEANMHRDSTTD